jgi:hypothetical protein
VLAEVKLMLALMVEARRKMDMRLVLVSLSIALAISSTAFCCSRLVAKDKSNEKQTIN